MHIKVEELLRGFVWECAGRKQSLSKKFLAGGGGADIVKFKFHVLLQILLFLIFVTFKKFNKLKSMSGQLKGHDIWGDDNEHEIPNSNAEELEREWRARREEFWNSGYREGLEAGKHDTVQEGFDEGEICIQSLKLPPAPPSSASNFTEPISFFPGIN